MCRKSEVCDAIMKKYLVYIIDVLPVITTKNIILDVTAGQYGTDADHAAPQYGSDATWVLGDKIGVRGSRFPPVAADFPTTFRWRLFRLYSVARTPFHGVPR